MPNVAALIVAAGSGSRFGGELPKQYQLLGGLPMLRRSVLPFLEHPQIAQVQIVIHPDFLEQYRDAVSGLSVLPVVAGGATRQESVRKGLEALAVHNPDQVLIHDAARPLVDLAIIQDVLTALNSGPAAIAAKPVTDTLKCAADNGVITATVARDALWQAQTPQGFHFEKILAAHQAAAGLGLTDDAAVAEHAGMTVRIVPSSPDNMKVTQPDDLERAARLLGLGLTDIRTGFGYDVHPLVPGDGVWLCGVKIPHDRKLEGHSDADVALHALSDAIYSALADDDIGAHFPNTDPRWKGAPSHIFLEHAASRVRAQGGQINHVSVTLLAEQPKINPHRLAMRTKLAELLGIAVERVAVQATTMERLGFIGREEGIVAQAVASVRLPE